MQTYPRRTALLDELEKTGEEYDLSPDTTIL